MTTTISIGLLLGLPAFFCVRHLVKEKRKQQKEMRLATAYERLLLQNKMMVEHYEIVGDGVIAIDSKNKKLGVVDLREKTPREHCISLLNIGETDIVEERNRRGHIEKIGLKLKRQIGDAEYWICFFDAVHDRVSELPNLAKKALHWKARLDRYNRMSYAPVEQGYSFQGA